MYKYTKLGCKRMKNEKKINSLDNKSVSKISKGIQGFFFVFCMFALFVCLFLLVESHFNNKAVGERNLYDKVTYEDNWDIYVWDKEMTEKSLYSQDVSFPLSYTKDNAISLVGVLPEIIGIDDWHLYVNTNYQAVDIYVDGRKVETASLRESLKIEKFSDNPWKAIKLTEDMCGKPVEIRVIGYGDKSIREVHTILAGANTDIRWVLLLDAITDELPCVIIGIVLVLVVLLTVFINGKYKISGYAESICLVIFVIFSILWVYTDSTMQGAFFVNSTLFYFVNIYSFLMMFIPFFMYARIRLNCGQWFFNSVVIAYLINVVLSTASIFAHSFRLSYSLMVSHVITFIAFFGLVFFCLYEMRVNKNKKVLDFLLGLIAIGVSGLWSVYNFYARVNADNTSGFRFGILLYMSILCVNGIWQSLKTIASGHLLQELSQSVPAGICRFVPDNNITITYANGFFYDMFGYEESSAKEIGFTNQRFCMISDEFAMYKKKIDENIANGIKQYELEARYVTAKRQVLWVMEKHSYNEETNEITAFVYDITSRKIMEEQLRISEENTRIAAANKSEFLANMSHEIRTPMNVICGMSNMLDSCNLTPLEHEYVEMIQSSANNLLNIVNDILDFTKVDMGKMDLIEREYSLPNLIYDVQNMTVPRISAKMLRYLVYVDPTIPTKLIGDDGRIKQILINLINNATKFTERGEISLVVSWEQKEDDIARLSFAVRDTGIGIKEEDIGKLFTQFSRVDTKKNRSIEGTGLGLALSKELAMKMNGDIQLQSVYGEGSIFTAIVEQKIVSNKKMGLGEAGKKYAVLLLEEDKVRYQSYLQALNDLGIAECTSDVERFILTQAEYKVVIYDYSNYYLYINEDKRLKKYFQLAMLEYGNKDVEERNDICYIQKPISIVGLLSHFTENGPIQKMKVVNNKKIIFRDVKAAVVDDNELNLKVADGFISRYGIKCELLNSGIKLLNKMQTGKSYDIVFLDHMMPELDGIETVQKIRAEGNEYWKNMPIIALTANAIKGVENKLIEAGMTDYLFKPIDVKRLEEILKLYLIKKCEIIDNETEEKPKELPDKDKIPKIPGYNTEEAVEMVGGSVGDYFAILADYVSQIPVSTKKLMEFLESHDIQSYTVLVHSIKSSSKLIGNEALFKEALSLELAGHEGNWDAIIAGTEKFVNNYQNQEAKLIQYIPKEYLLNDEDEESVSDNGNEGQKNVLTGLSNIIKALEDYDDELAMKEWKAIYKYQIFDSYRDKVESLKRLIIDVNYEEAITLTQELLDTLEEE